MTKKEVRRQARPPVPIEDHLDRSKLAGATTGTLPMDYLIIRGLGVGNQI